MPRHAAGEGACELRRGGGHREQRVRENGPCDGDAEVLILSLVLGSQRNARDHEERIRAIERAGEAIIDPRHLPVTVRVGARATVRRSRELEMEAEIGIAAGMIWRYLDQHGETSLSQLKRATKLSDQLLLMGLGWLAREEDKVGLARDTKVLRLRTKRQ
jgi:winged helix-turn-helix protein DUF2582